MEGTYVGKQTRTKQANRQAVDHCSVQARHEGDRGLVGRLYGKQAGNQSRRAGIQIDRQVSRQVGM